MPDESQAPLPSKSLAARIASSLFALMIGAIGGALFYLIGAPLPWMLGALAATLIVVVPFNLGTIDRRVSIFVFPVMGVLIGASFQPEILDNLARWPGGLIVVVVYTVTATFAGTFYFTRVCGWDRTTAFYASPPGGLSEMVLVGGAAGADERRLVLTHSIRIAIVVVSATLVINFILDPGLASRPPALATPQTVSAFDWLVLAGCAVLGALLGRGLRLPGGVLFGALVLSAAAHLTGLTHVSPPGWLVSGAQVLLGCALGSRFLGVTRGELKAVVGHAVVWAIILLMIALLIAILLAALLGLDGRAFFLALAPGGFSEMLIVALAIGIESAFVATSHTLRIFIIILVLPLLQSALLARKRIGQDKG